MMGARVPCFKFDTVFSMNSCARPCGRATAPRPREVLFNDRRLRPARRILLRECR
jgi:hypothetical protein